MGILDIFKRKNRQSNEDTKDSKIISYSISISEPNPLTKAEIDSQIVPVEKRIKAAIPSKHGLFPHEILALDYAHTFYTHENSFQGFWWYKYGVRDVQAVLSSLNDRGFLQIGDIGSALEKQNVSVLKEVLRKYDLKVSGKKVELIERVIDNIPEEEIKALFPKRTYALTELGKAALEEEAYVPYIHKHSIEDLDIWSLNQIVHTQPYMPYRDKIWGYLNHRCTKHLKNGDLGLYRNSRYSMSNFLIEEDKYLDALGMLAEVVFLDLSGTWNGFDIRHLNIFAKSFFPYSESLCKTAPGVISTITNCQEKLHFSDEELKVALTERMEKLTTPIQLFSVHECVQIFFLERDQNTEALTKMYTKAEGSFRQKYPNISLEKLDF
ncbi:MAG TPA: SAP domain-containing protein [Epulopiscium sp.]|nr:SAP domain-containing protein [Candidatus Epulonipiscium sp.]